MPEASGDAPWVRSRLRRLNPGCALGGQLERLKRLSSGSDGREFKLIAGGNYIPVHDDSHAHAAAHRATERVAEETWVDLIMASLPDVDRAILELKHTPVASMTLRVERRLCDVREGDGACLVSLCKDGDGVLNGFGVFEVQEPVAPTDAAIADILFAGWVDMTGRRHAPMGDEGVAFSEHQIRYRARRAYRAIDEHPILERVRIEDAA